MSGVKKNLWITAAAAILILAGVFAIAGRSTVHASSFHEEDKNVWTDGSTSYYGKGDSLYKKVGGKETGLVTFHAEHADKGEPAYAKVVNVYGAYVYVLQQNDVGESKLYSYNLESGKLTLCSSKCYVCKANGAYMLALPYEPTDVSAHALTLYKAQGEKVKKVRQLASYSVEWSQIYKGKFIYASFASPDLSGNMKIMSCKADGTKAKTLFTIKGSKETLTVVYSKGTKITVSQSYNEGDKPVTLNYVYDLKSGKLKKKN